MGLDIVLVRQLIQACGFEPDRVLAVELTGSHAIVYEGEKELERVHKIPYTEDQTIVVHSE